jgi:hypothetical protein
MRRQLMNKGVTVEIKPLAYIMSVVMLLSLDD